MATGPAQAATETHDPTNQQHCECAECEQIASCTTCGGHVARKTARRQHAHHNVYTQNYTKTDR
eukprot:11146981-Alexandrium_andersonii.AAC.1